MDDLERANKIWGQLEFKRMELARALFSPQSHSHSLSNAKRIASLAADMVAIASRLEDFRK